MGNTWIAWLLALPVGGAAIASLILQLGGRGGPTPSRLRLETIALTCGAVGILLAMLVSLAAEGRALFLGVGFDFSPPTRTMLFVVNIALLCSLFISWSSSARPDRRLSVWTTPVTSSLLAGALLAQDGIISVLCLLGAALVVAASAFVTGDPPGSIQEAAGNGAPTAGGDQAQVMAGKRITGGLKHLSLAVIGTGLLVVGVLLLSRYNLNLENRALLQLGVGLLSIGLLVRAGAMPFAIATADLVDAAPGPATNLFGAVTPAVLLVGLLLLLPIDRTLLAGNSTAWVGAIAVLLAGVRASGVRLPDRHASAHGDVTPLIPGELVSATIAAQIGWSLTGLLLGSHSGAAGALLLAVNLALAVPLLIVSATRARSGPRLFRVGLAIGVASLLGLPPLGGFAGTLLIAQAVATLGGFWVAVMLLGSMLVAAKWLSLTRLTKLRITNYELQITKQPVNPKPKIQNLKLDTDLLLVVVLVVSQIALLALSLPLADTLSTLASPWLSFILDFGFWILA